MSREPFPLVACRRESRVAANATSFALKLGCPCGLSGTSWQRRLAAATLVLPLVVLAGCADEGVGNASVTGVVTLDGKPLEQGIVTFAAADDEAGVPASGQIQADGSYHVQIGRSGTVASGEYAVAVSARARSVENPNGGPPTPGPLITPERYAAAKDSGLRYRVRSGDNVIDIALSTVSSDANEGDADDEIGAPAAKSSDSEENASEEKDELKADAKEQTTLEEFN